MLEIGQLVANYHVVRQIEIGGNGAVFEAVHQYIGRRAAIKVLLPELSKNPQSVNRFLNEARAVNLVKHPGLVQIFEFGLLPDETTYIIMEFLEGETMARRTARQDTRWQMDDLRLFRQISLALQAAHDKGIVHRDLKPENIMVVPDPERAGRERAKILDFGIAKLAAEHVGPDRARYKTQAGMVFGTPQYMAPERCTLLSSADSKVDVYALGVMLYERLAGKLPFDSKELMEIMIMQVRDTPRPLSDVDPAIPAGLAALVHTMLAKAPGERPTMAQVADRLTRLLNEDRRSGSASFPRAPVPLLAAPDFGDDPTVVDPTVTSPDLDLDASLGQDESKTVAMPLMGESSASPPAKRSTSARTWETRRRPAVGLAFALGCLGVLVIWVLVGMLMKTEPHSSSAEVVPYHWPPVPMPPPGAPVPPTHPEDSPSATKEKPSPDSPPGPPRPRPRSHKRPSQTLQGEKKNETVKIPIVH